MKRILLFPVIVTAVVVAEAQLSIRWHSIDGGGGISTGGSYALSGTVGQYDAGTNQMTGGSFTLAGGFWSVFAVQTEGAPLLTIVLVGSGHALISWAPDSPGWILQQTDSLTNIWSNAPSLETNNVTVPTTPQNRFYRLHYP
jgi:hypothetical protein